MRKTILIKRITRSGAGRKLKKYFLLFSIGLFCITTFANPPLESKQQIGMFKNSKTCVVYENGSIAYNVYIKDAVQKFWKSTEYEFIDQA